MSNEDFFARELAFTAARLKQAGEIELRRELQKAVTDATRDIPRNVYGGLKERLPDRYVLDDFRPDLSVTVSKRYGSRDPAVRVIARTRSGKRRSLARIDRGVLTHPLFGDWKLWYNQAVIPGFFTVPAEEAAAGARKHISDALDRVYAEAMRRGAA